MRKLAIAPLFLLLASAALAQLPGQQRRSDVPPRRSPEQRDARVAETLGSELKLEPEKVKKIQSILEDARRAAAPLEEELQQGRVKLLGALREGKSDAEIERLNAVQGEIYSRISANESWAVAKIFGLLVDEQKKVAAAVIGRAGSIASARPQGGTPPWSRQQN